MFETTLEINSAHLRPHGEKLTGKKDLNNGRTENFDNICNSYNMYNLFDVLMCSITEAS